MRCPQNPEGPFFTLVYEPSPLAEQGHAGEKSLRLRAAAPCPLHGASPWLSPLEGFALTLWSQGKGWKRQVKTQLGNVSKLENVQSVGSPLLRVSPCQPQPWDPSPVGLTPVVPVPWVKFNLGLYGAVWGPKFVPFLE